MGGRQRKRRQGEKERWELFPQAKMLKEQGQILLWSFQKGLTLPTPQL